MPRPRSRATVLSATLLAAASFGVAPAGAQAPAPPTIAVPAGSNVVTVVAREYFLDFPASIPAGLTTFRLLDEGKEQHHFFLAKLEGGKTPADLVMALRAGGPPPRWMVMMGGPNSPAPGGGEADVTLVLPAGNYAAFCIIPAPDGVPHVMKGMIRGLTVTPSSRKAPTPESDLSITLTDYDFQFSRPISAGPHTIEVTNTSGQPHEMFIFRIPPGHSIADLTEWAAHPQGPVPVTPMGGTTALAPGHTVYVQADFTPGEYAMICFVPDARDGQMHFVHGMQKRFTVR